MDACERCDEVVEDRWEMIFLDGLTLATYECDTCSAGLSPAFRESQWIMVTIG
jgi:hypothetical protein